MSLEIAARLKLNSSDYTGGVKAAKKETKGLRDEFGRFKKAGDGAGKGMRDAAGGADKLTKAEKKLQKQSKSTAQDLMKIKNVVTGIAFGLGAQDFSSTILEYEKLKAQMVTTFKGSEEMSEAAMRSLEDFARTTPFSLEQSVQAFIKLRNLGITPTRELMASMGNTATAMGKDMGQFMEAIADAGTGEFERLKEFGINASSQGDQVAFTFKGLTTTVGKTQKEIVAYLQSIGETNFASAMKDQMSGLPGELSNFRMNVKGVWQALGDVGATDLYIAAIAGVSGVVGDLATMIRSGYLGEALQIQFAGWIDAAGGVKDGLVGLAGWIDENVISPITYLLLGNDFDINESSLVQFGGFVKDSFADLPANLSAIFTIIIGEVDKLRLGAMEKFELLGLGISEAWLDVQHTGESAFSMLELAAAMSIDFIIEQFADMVGGIGATLEGLPDVVVPDSWITGIRESEAAIRSHADAEAGVREEIIANSAAYEQELAVINQKRAASSQYYAERKAGADSAIASALAERDATLQAKEQLLAEAKANHESGKAAKVSAEEHNKLAAAGMAAGDAAESEGEQAAKAAGITIKAAEKKLAAVIKATDSERDKVIKWYKESVEALEEAERLKLDATADYAVLRGKVDEEYAVRLDDLNKKQVADHRKSLEEQLKNSGAFGQTALTIYDELADVQQELWAGNVDAAIDSFDDILDALKDFAIEFALRWAASGIDKLFGIEDSSFNFSSVFGGSGGLGLSDLASVFSGSSGRGGRTPGFVGGIADDYIGAGTSNYLSAAGDAFGIYDDVKNEDYLSALLRSQSLYDGLISAGSGAAQGGQIAINAADFFAQEQSIQAMIDSGQIGINGTSTALGANDVILHAGGEQAGQQAANQLGWSNYAGAAIGAYNVYAGLDRGGSAGISQAASGGLTAYGSLMGMGPYGWAAAAVLGAYGAFGGSRSKDEIGADQYGKLMNRNPANIDFGGGESFIGSYNENTQFYGSDLNEDQLGDVSKILEQRYGLRDARAIGDGVLRIANRDRNFSEHGDTITAEVLAAIAEVETGFTELERVATQSMGDAIVEMDRIFDASADSGLTAGRRILDAYKEAFDATEKEAQEWLKNSEINGGRYAQIFESASDDALATLIGLTDEGQTQFDLLTDAAKQSAVDMTQYFGDFGGYAGGAIEEIIAKWRALNGATFNVSENNAGGQTLATEVPSYAVGTPRLQSDGLIYAHQNEAVVDAQSVTAIKRYFSADVSGGGGNNAEIAQLVREVAELNGQIKRLLPAQRVSSARQIHRAVSA